ncbi:hypothetical protein ABZX40_12490 [Streptomyces sp. NPDC004610]|uniref:hypothetical protein n=1 Tax=unclassified Streptomyces TaxID=2593676 RepID=UPI00339F567B
MPQAQGVPGVPGVPGWQWLVGRVGGAVEGVGGLVRSGVEDFRVVQGEEGAVAVVGSGVGELGLGER